VREEILEKQPEARLKVYAIWFNMIWTDSRSRWPAEILADPRVQHFWDEGRVVGRWYEENVTHRGDEVEWDAFFVYGPETAWDAKPPQVVTWDRTIVGAKERLREALRQLLEKAERRRAIHAGRRADSLRKWR
jgi:hypothetical protein